MQHQHQNQQQKRRPDCNWLDCKAKASPSGTGYCSYHDWKLTSIGNRPGEWQENDEPLDNPDDCSAVASQRHTSNTEKQNRTETVVCDECLGEDGVHHDTCKFRFKVLAMEY